MEFKEKLKALRQQRGLSQQALADAIFVSRSAVAKWENGLGVPSQDSMLALEQFFSVTRNDFLTEAPEEVIAEKNQKISVLSAWLTAVLVVSALLCGTLTVLILMGFRFTSLGAAGDMFADNPTVWAGEYQFYLSDGTLPTYAQAVKRDGFLYRVVEGEQQLLYDEDSHNVGVLDRFPGKERDHYLLFTVGFIEKMESDGEEAKAYVTYPWACDHITVNGELVPLEFKSYFTLEEPIHELRIHGKIITIEAETPVN